MSPSRQFIMTAPPHPSVRDESQRGLASAQDPEATNYIAWKEWAPENFGRYSRLDAAYFAAEVGLGPPARAKVLEIGFGNGSFLAWARDAGAEIYGVELNPLLVSRARQLLGNGRAFNGLSAPDLDEMRGTFTHIVAFDVLEHIEQGDYAFLFNRLAEMLARGGKCVLRFPNGDSPFGRRIQHADPTHVTTIGSGKLIYFAQHAGFKIDAVRNPALPTSGVGLRRGLKRRLVLIMRFALESFIGALYCGRRIPFDENFTAVLIRT
jgi:2-polyprenyl-3-methyl-5-hydroxy-6-metoxy-1,4-benzoquinol methylase